MIIGIYVACYAVIVGSTEEDTETYGLSTAPEIEQPDDGLFDILASIIAAVWGVVLLILGAFIFNVPGAPFWVQIPIATSILGSLAWSIATLVRGN